MRVDAFPPTILILVDFRMHRPVSNRRAVFSRVSLDVHELDKQLSVGNIRKPLPPLSSDVKGRVRSED